MERILSHQKVPIWKFHISQRNPPLQDYSTTSPHPIYYWSDEMYDARFTATFSETDVKIYNTEDQCILTGTRNLQNHMLVIKVYLFPDVGPILHYAVVSVSQTATTLYVVQ